MVIGNNPTIKFPFTLLPLCLLVRYAEEQQDLALLSISTFQRALKASVTSEMFNGLVNFNEDSASNLSGS